MQRLTVNIPDNKLNFFIELVRNLGFVQIEHKTEKKVLTEHQKELVNIEREKIKENPDYLLDWEEARKSLKLD